MPISGPLRLGIVATCVWFIAATSVYLASIALYPVGIATTVPWLFDWHPGVEEIRDGIAFTPDLPSWSLRATILLLGIPGAMWLMLYVAPKTFKWVKAGFDQDSSRE